MNFRSAYIKLSIFYVLIVMTISIIFSVAIYKISTFEIGRGLNRQGAVFYQPSPRESLRMEFERLIGERVKESNERLRNNLVLLNFLILTLSGIASYFLAKKTLDPIEKMMSAQNRFTADASHELRTPLTAMKTEIEVNLRDRQLSIAEAKEQLKSNLEEIAKLEALSSALLQLAKYEQQTRAEFGKVFVDKVLAEAISKVAKFSKMKNISIQLNPSDANIKGDRDSLRELFIILLDNALKYSPDNTSIKVDISSRDKFIEISFADQGFGIDEKNIGHIFDRFYRADGSRSKQGQGALGYGLGLSIAKSIVDLHEGKIIVESKKGKGSRFIVLLPA